MKFQTKALPTKEELELVAKKKALFKIKSTKVKKPIKELTEDNLFFDNFYEPFVSKEKEIFIHFVPRILINSQRLRLSTDGKFAFHLTFVNNDYDDTKPDLLSLYYFVPSLVEPKDEDILDILISNFPIKDLTWKQLNNKIIELVRTEYQVEKEELLRKTQEIEKLELIEKHRLEDLEEIEKADLLKQSLSSFKRIGDNPITSIVKEETKKPIIQGFKRI